MMDISKKMGPEFSWDEAIFLAKLSKEVYEVFQQKKSLEGTELLELYNLLCCELIALLVDPRLKI